jgi:hypothetical protein
MSDLKAPSSMRDGNFCTIKLFLAGKVATDAGLEVLDEPGGVHVVPEGPVPAAMALRGGMHKEMQFVERKHPQQIPRGRKVQFGSKKDLWNYRFMLF